MRKICYFTDINVFALVKYSPYPLAYLQSSVPSQRGRAGHLSRCQKMGSLSLSLIASSRTVKSNGRHRNWSSPGRTGKGKERKKKGRGGKGRKEGRKLYWPNEQEGGEGGGRNGTHSFVGSLSPLGRRTGDMSKRKGT